MTVERLLDNGWAILLYRNSMGSYTSMLVPVDKLAALTDYVESLADSGPHITDHFTVAESLEALVDKQSNDEAGG